MEVAIARIRNFRLTPVRLWCVFFALWGLFLSGILTGLSRAPVSSSASLSSPGVVQAIRLSGLLESKRRQVDQLESEILKLQEEATALEKDRVVQHREIRRVLGYAAPDELIFDF